MPYGYPLEEHFVTTSDGYILRLFRIPHGNGAGPPAARHARAAAAAPEAAARAYAGAARPMVHLQHCLLGASVDWVLNGPGASLAFLLADAGAKRGRNLPRCPPCARDQPQAGCRAAACCPPPALGAPPTSRTPPGF